jgi:hypothetical protein
MPEGHCLCRAVAFSFDAEPNWVLNCHCETCRRSTSAPMTTWLSVPRAAFRFTGAPPRHYASSKGVRRGFCGSCGSPLTYESDGMPNEIHVLACALADPAAVRPVAHVFAGEQLPWFDTADELPRYEKTRPDGPPMRHGPRRSL